MGWLDPEELKYHSGYRYGGGGGPQEGWTHFEKTGRVEWVSDLAEIPGKYGVTNVYGDLGQIFAQSTMANPRLGAAMMGILDSRSWRRSRLLGNRCDLNGVAAMADRSTAAARDP